MSDIMQQRQRQRLQVECSIDPDLVRLAARVGGAL
jgi:hypothetical protein